MATDSFDALMRTGLTEISQRELMPTVELDELRRTISRRQRSRRTLQVGSALTGTALALVALLFVAPWAGNDRPRPTAASTPGPSRTVPPPETVASVPDTTLNQLRQDGFEIVPSSSAGEAGVSQAAAVAEAKREFTSSSASAKVTTATLARVTSPSKEKVPGFQAISNRVVWIVAFLEVPGGEPISHRIDEPTDPNIHGFGTVVAFISSDQPAQLVLGRSF